MLILLSLPQGAEFDDLSFKEYTDEYGFRGGNVMLEGGYIALLDAMVAKHKRSPIAYNKVVTLVECTGKEYVISVEDGTRYRCTNVVCTIPIPVLLAKVEFRPSLPPRTMEAMRGMGTGLMDKALLYFPSWTWPSEVGRITYVSDTKGCWPWFDPYPVLHAGGGVAVQCWTACDFAEKMENRSDEHVVEELMRILRDGT